MDLLTIGVSSAKKKQFEARGINTVEDLLQFLPRAYKDFRYITGILPEDQVSIFRATIIDSHVIATSRIPMFTAACVEESSGQTVTVRWFHMNWFQREVRHLAEDRAKVIVVGKVDYNPQFGFGLSQPEVFEPDSRALKIYPVYRAIPGMSSEYFNGKMSKALTIGVKDSEVLPAEVLKASGRIDMPTALTFLHAPKTMEEIELGRARILLNDLLYFAIHNDVKRRALEMLIETAKIAFRGRKISFRYMLSDGSWKLMEFDGDEFAENNYGIVVDGSSDVKNLDQKLESLAQAAMQRGSITFSAIMKMWTSSLSLAEKIKIIEKSEKDAMTQAQQAQEQQLQAQQQQAEAQLAQKQAELEAQAAMNSENNETKILVAQIQAENKVQVAGMSSTSGDDGIPTISPDVKAKIDEQIREFNLNLQQDNKKIAIQKERNEIARIAAKRKPTTSK